ncbi:nucleotide-binding universal stress UspA family protein [Halohasta litchfieldiae]|jgi:nucleotide-binding universal stress UspA family protein|uniref:Nucleotide-binding universal stress protein, UspA family n=1 Tax=Halohasta litchfieldiae TaxID=1073996 RepID=A0A1H6SDF6_9EURY|nr:universal stress protein [Halohasta litchfieldiae]ATW87931.1 nucleotide-binding universal stress UspA family protein [Halohasta litchfieldiae]SEI62050.1 Nucleotide-binding universal stress protein, UspA family [Halohasta litchfieldiae]
MYDNILYPTDGSKGAEAVVDHAHDLASKYDATLHVLFVVDAEHIQSGMVPRHERGEHGEGEERVTGMMKRDEKTAGEGHMSRHNDEFLEAIKERGHELTDAVASELAEGGVDTVTAVREGEPHQVITEYAEEADIDLIMMGTHGRRGIRRRLIGSVTEKVVRISDRPVMTVRLSE